MASAVRATTAVATMEASTTATVKSSASTAGVHAPTAAGVTAATSVLGEGGRGETQDCHG